MTAPGKCQACGHPARDSDPIVTARVDLGPGWGGQRSALVHVSHTLDPASGLFGSPFRSGGDLAP